MPVTVSEILDSQTPQSAATMNIAVTKMQTIVAWTSAQDETVNIAGGKVGYSLWLIIANDGTLPRTITFGTGILAAVATVVGTLSKKAVCKFIHNGTSFVQETAVLTGI